MKITAIQTKYSFNIDLYFNAFSFMFYKKKGNWFQFCHKTFPFIPTLMPDNISEAEPHKYDIQQDTLLYESLCSPQHFEASRRK